MAPSAPSSPASATPRPAADRQNDRVRVLPEAVWALGILIQWFWEQARASVVA
jgi:hypothetical protein